jgi:hypothetical protein
VIAHTVVAVAAPMVGTPALAGFQAGSANLAWFFCPQILRFRFVRSCRVSKLARKIRQCVPRRKV